MEFNNISSTLYFQDEIGHHENNGLCYHCVIIFSKF